MTRLAMVVFSALLLIGLAACARTMPVYNVGSMPVETGSGAQLSADQVRDAIIEAAHTKGWFVQPESDNRLIATVHVRTHMAEVEIAYSPTEYSISYKDSDNLLYNGSDIHRNYNKWVQLLEVRINEKLRQL